MGKVCVLKGITTSASAGLLFNVWYEILFIGVRGSIVRLFNFTDIYLPQSLLVRFGFFGFFSVSYVQRRHARSCFKEIFEMVTEGRFKSAVLMEFSFSHT